jgi:hypothetical protein
MSDDTVFAASEDQTVAAEIEKLKPQFTKADGSLDVDALLKSKAHANLHVAKVEGEAANLRKDLDTRLTYQDLLDKINTQRPTTSSDDDDSHIDQRDGNPKAISEQDIERKLDEMLKRKQQEAAQVANIQYVAETLSKAMGPNWTEQLRQVAKDIHYPEAEIDRLAKTNPKALLAIVLPKTPSTDHTPPLTRHNTTASPGTKERNWAYYQQLMKTDKKKFESLSSQMHDDAKRLGPDFYN